MELRDYQAGMIDQARDHFRAGMKRILLQLATGGGKTAMAAFMMKGAAARGLRCHFHVHRKELIEQTSATFRDVGIPHGFVAAGMPFDPLAPVVLCGVQTLRNRLEDCPPPDMILTDECHHKRASTWQDIDRAYPDALQVGLTATPERLDGQGLSDDYQVMVKGPSTAELIERGYLSSYRYFAPGKPDLVGVPVRAGDYNRGELGDAMDKPKLIGDVVEHYLRLAKGQRGVVFAVNREHSRHLADAFQGEGVRAANVDGSMDDKERSRIVGAFRAGDLDVMVNVDLFGEGFDVPAMVYAGLCRPTKSLALHLQQVGRALRIFEGKEQAIICDHAGNALSGLGLPDDAREWTLEGRKKRKGGAVNDDAIPIRQCPECYRVTASTVKVCPGCGFEHATVYRPPAWEEGELFELERIADLAKKNAAKQRKDEERACRDVADFMRLAVERGYKSPRGWALQQVKMRQQYAQRFRRRA